MKDEKIYEQKVAATAKPVKDGPKGGDGEGDVGGGGNGGPGKTTP